VTTTTTRDSAFGEEGKKSRESQGSSAKNSLAAEILRLIIGQIK
jgi:hypothetical protein